MSEHVKGSQPENTAGSAVAAPAKRQPKEGVATYTVRTRGVLRFIRCGITFGPDPTVVDAASLTPEQKIELLNTDTLDVQEGGEAAHAETAAKTSDDRHAHETAAKTSKR